MASSDPMDILLKHDKWATGQILHACASLTPEQFHRKFEMGPGSLHNVLLHMISAQRGWTDALNGREFRPLMDPNPPRSVDELVKMHEEIADEFAATARKFPVDDTIKRDRGGKVYTFTRGAVITHVTTHGMHHRAQCLNMLRHVGVSPLPPTSVVEWMRLVDTPQ
ncbi:MAG: DinB family protein [Tepidisphaeraceae bacterium]|jgi:uncharacterized damage-inducible protein DinB